MTLPLRKSIAIVLENTQGETLFGKRSLKKRSFPGEWSLPSFDIQENETNEEVIRRIGKDKLGCVLEPIKLLNKGTQERKDYFLELSLYSAKLVEGTPQSIDGSYDEVSWSLPQERFATIQHFGLCTKLYKDFLGL